MGPVTSDLLRPKVSSAGTRSVYLGAFVERTLWSPPLTSTPKITAWGDRKAHQRPVCCLNQPKQRVIASHTLSLTIGCFKKSETDSVSAVLRLHTAELRLTAFPWANIGINPSNTVHHSGLLQWVNILP